jgi:trimethylamine corrinoid protein
MADKSEILTKLSKSVTDMSVNLAEEAANEAVAAGLDPLDCITHGLSVGMAKMSDLFDDGEVFVPELLTASDAFDAAVKILTAGMTEEEKNATSQGKVVIATVAGDIHDIGKNIVKTLFEANNFTVFDLGRDVAVDAIVDKVKEVDADLVLGSALMTTTMPSQRDIINGLVEAGLRDDVIVMFGGAPVTQKWCDEIGADGYSDSAAECVAVAKSLLAKKREKEGVPA